MHVTWTTAPVAPTGTAFEETMAAGGGDVMAFRVSWKEANPTGVTIRIYGVTRCLVEALPPLFSQVPCITPKTAIPSADLSLMASLPAATEVYSWTAPSGEGSPILDPTGRFVYYGILITAVNNVGRSAYVLVTASTFCNGCTAWLDPVVSNDRGDLLPRAD